MIMKPNEVLLTKQDAEQFQIWIKALRSGKYKQTRGRLQDRHGYCCYGVACEVLIPKNKRIVYPSGLLVGAMPIDQFNSPQWLQNVNVVIPVASLNDSIVSKHPFEEIANELEYVFTDRVNELLN